KSACKPDLRWRQKIPGHPLVKQAIVKQAIVKQAIVKHPLLYLSHGRWVGRFLQSCPTSYWMTWNRFGDVVFARGICKSGMGRPEKSLRQGIASPRAQELARFV